MDDYSNDIDKYLKGQLTPAQMNALEKKALNDPFLADALQGLDSLQAAELQDDIHDLQGRLARRTRKGTTLLMWTGRIAAGLIMVALSTFLILFISNRQEDAREHLAINKEESLAQEQQTQPVAPSAPDSTGPGQAAQPDVSEQRAEETIKPSQAEKPSDTRSRVEEPERDSGDGRAESEVAEEKLTDEGAVDARISDQLREGDKTVSSEQPQSIPSEVTLEDARKKELTRTADDAPVSRKESPGARAQGAAASASVARKIIRGKVTFSEDGTGLPGVNVLVKDSNEGTVSDAQGNYQIAVEGQPTLQFSFIGFSTEEVEATSNELNVKLNTDVSELSEVVVVGESDDVGFLPSTPTIMELAAPEGGRRMFKQYLEQNLQYPQAALENQIEGKVTVQFNIDMTGQLSNFRVIRGLGFGCEEEVIRLIKQGPKWSPSKKNEAPIKDRVRVRMRFSLPKK